MHENEKRYANLKRIKNEKSNEITFFATIDDEISIKKEMSTRI